MALIKLILAIVIMAVTMSLSTRIFTDGEEAQISQGKTTIRKQNTTLVPRSRKKASRFLAEQEKPFRNPNAAENCNKNEEICRYKGDANSTMACCSNKCSDLENDNGNCGECMNKCGFTETCCRGECVYLSYDKRHCGECNHQCQDNEYCVYGICNYA